MKLVTNVCITWTAEKELTDQEAKETMELLSNKEEHEKNKARFIQQINGELGLDDECVKSYSVTVDGEVV